MYISVYHYLIDECRARSAVQGHLPEGIVGEGEFLGMPTSPPPPLKCVRALPVGRRKQCPRAAELGDP